MQIWMIIALAAALGAVMYFMMKRKTLTTTGTLTASSSGAAPGVNANTGEVYQQDNLPDPNAQPTQGSLIKRTNGLSSSIASHVPIVGGAASSVVGAAGGIAKGVTSIGFGAVGAINNKITNVLSNIPIAGKALAVPGKVAGAAVKSVGKALKSVFSFGF